MRDLKKSEETKTTTTAKAKSAAKAKTKTAPKAAAVKAPAKMSAAKATAKKEDSVKKDAPAKKTAAKTAAKTAVKKTAAKSAPKTSTRKTKSVTIDTICDKLKKKIDKTKAAGVKSTIGVDIEVYEFEDGSNQKMYVEIKDGKVTVAPHSYDDKSFRVAISFANAVAFVNGKVTLAELLDSDKFYAEGNIADAIKFAAIF